MPKLFSINLEVEELAVGRVFRQLHNMPGVAKVHLDMGTPKTGANGEARAPRGPYKPRKTFTTTGTEEIAKALNKSKMSNKELRDHFNDMGRSANSVNSILFDMKNAGDIKMDTDGVSYMLTKKMRDRLRHKK